MSQLTVSDATGDSRFTSFTFEISDSQSLQSLRDESETVYSFSVEGKGARAAQAKLKAIEARDLLGIRMNMAGTRDAVAFRGELVTLSTTVYNSDETDDTETVSVQGIVTNVSWSAGAGGFLVQRVDFALQVCDRLWIRSGAGEPEMLEAPGVE